MKAIKGALKEVLKEVYFRKNAYFDEYEILKQNYPYLLNMEKKEDKIWDSKILDRIEIWDRIENSDFKIEFDKDKSSLIDIFPFKAEKETFRIKNNTRIKKDINKKGRKKEQNEGENGEKKKEKENKRWKNDRGEINIFRHIYYIESESNFEITIIYKNAFIGFEEFFIKNNAKGKINILYDNTFSYISRYIHLYDNADLNINIIGRNRSFIENRNIITFYGENAKADERAALLNIEGNVRFYTQLNHYKKENKSNSSIYIATFNNGNASIEGLIKIFKGSENSDAFLEQKALICSKNSRAYCYPSLEIENNNVRATHSSYLTRIEDEDLFYLRSRALSYAQSYVELVKSFLNQSVNVEIAYENGLDVENDIINIVKKMEENK